jgi:hypothetical protein
MKTREREKIMCQWLSCTQFFHSLLNFHACLKNILNRIKIDFSPFSNEIENHRYEVEKIKVGRLMGCFCCDTKLFGKKFINSGNSRRKTRENCQVYTEKSLSFLSI